MKTIHKPETKIKELLDIFNNFQINNLEAIYYLFRLILLKYIFDINATKSNRYSLTIPHDISWDEWRRSGEEVIKQLTQDALAIEKENSILNSVFSSFDFQLYLTEIQANNLLERLILKLSDLDLSKHKTVRQIDLALCQQLNNESKNYGSYITPESITNLVVKLLNPQEKMSICDPFCGSGSFLVECAAQFPDSSLNSISFYGQEINPDIEVISRIRLLLYGVNNFNIQLGDTIQEPKLLQDDKLQSFDLIMSIFPWGKQNLGQDIVTSDPYHRFRYGIPSKSATEFIYIQHILATLNSNGKAVVIVPNGVLFRGGSEGKIRENIIKADLLEAVIAFPANLINHTGISTAILIFNQSKPQERQDTVLFIDASYICSQKSSYYYLSDKNSENIVETYTYFSEKEGYAKIVSLNKFAENDYLLNVNRYVFLPKQTINLHSELTKLNKLEAEQDRAEKDFNQNLKNYLETVEENKYFDALFKINDRNPCQYPYGIFFSHHPACGGDDGFYFLWFESFAEMKDFFIDFELLKYCLLGFETLEKETVVSNAREGFNTICDNPRNWQLGIEKLNHALSEWIEVKWCGTFKQLLQEKGEFETEVRKHFLTNIEDLQEQRIIKDREIQENEIEDFRWFLVDYGI